MKKIIKNTVSSVCFLLILALLLSYTNHVLRDKNESYIVRPYYNERENSLDTIFVGSSHIMCGVYPMDLWNEYGIASYNYASSAMITPQAYYQVVEAFRTQSPKVMVIDISGVAYGDKKISSNAYAHVQLDNMKWSMNKVNAIQDLIGSNKRLEFYFPLIKFHSRWKSVKNSDFEPIEGKTKGAFIGYGNITVEDSFKVMPKEYTADISDTAEKYLRKILDYCKSKNCEVVLVHTPTVADEISQGTYNAVYPIAEEYNVPYLNLMHEIDAMQFDFEKDMRDKSHCNKNGAVKITRFIGEFLKENYDLPDRRQDDSYADWHEYYSEYKKIYSYTA